MTKIRWLGALGLLLLLASDVHAHPKPGAHADVRISVERDGVRVEALMNLLFVEQLINWPRVQAEEVSAEEEQAVAALLLAYFGSDVAGPTPVIHRPNAVYIDGIRVPPRLVACSVVRPAPEVRPGFEQNPALLIPRVHAIIEYSAKSPPRTVSLVWGTYPRDFLAQERDLAPRSPIDAVVTGMGHFDLVTFRYEEPEFVWHAPATGPATLQLPQVAVRERRTVPLAAISVGGGWLVIAGAMLLGRKRVAWAQVGAGTAAAAAAMVVLWPLGRVGLPEWMEARVEPIEPGAAVALFLPLHANIYRAFDYTTESDIYDALAQSVDGRLLEQIYNDVYQGLVMREEGGALSRVRELTPLGTRVVESGVGPDRRPQFRVNARWRVQGVVHHWGHSHERTTEYAADYTVAAAPAGWRIVGCTPLSQQRIQTEAQAASEAAVSPVRVEETPAWHPSR